VTEAVEHGYHRERSLCGGHFRGCLCTQGSDGFTLGMPTGGKRRELGLPTCSFASRPPIPELLKPAGTASASMRSPDKDMSIHSHHSLLHVLLTCCHFPWYTIRSTLTILGHACGRWSLYSDTR
jgi:hypothetical protein